jgi:competence protein ComEA
MKKLILLLSLFAVNAIASPVNVNTADAKTISESLSGIGQKKAEAIVKYREEKGLFKTAEDLTNVAGIGEKTVAKNKNDILLSDATPAAAVVEPKKETKSK